jgi:NAD(P)-dependent dehydrogenase (short-subunit alcohol dehydrogenase family)
VRLENKTAVIYGAGGAIGAAVVRAFAREGATLFLTGRNQTKVDAVAKDIRASGGKAVASQVDALDEQGIDKHLDAMTTKAGKLDISFNAVGIPNTTLQGVPLSELSVEQFSLPIETYFLFPLTVTMALSSCKSGHHVFRIRAQESECSAPADATIFRPMRESVTLSAWTRSGAP